MAIKKSDYLQLRPLDFQPVYHQGQLMWLLRDPLQLTPQQLVFPPALAQILLLLDGRHDVDTIHQHLCHLTGERIAFAVVADAIAALDEAGLLENERSDQLIADLLDTYRAQLYRPPALAGLSYPAEPNALTALFDGYRAANGSNATMVGWSGQAVVSPHIDYERGGPVYAQVWQAAETAVAEADLVLIFGTDHNGGPGTFTLTRQPYATPYGPLPTDTSLIDSVANAIGPEEAYKEELHHRGEHAIELSVVWLHYTYQRLRLEPRPMIPILCGSFHHFMLNGDHPERDKLLTKALDALRQATAGRRVLAVASVDLAHVGPVFGDDFTMDAARRQQVQQADEGLITAVTNGDAAQFYQQIAAVQDRHRVCGFAPIYLMLRYLDSVSSGRQVAYAHCPADPDNHSLVSICGLLLD
jgi:MEMO1 family protein